MKKSRKSSKQKPKGNSSFAPPTTMPYGFFKGETIDELPEICLFEESQKESTPEPLKWALSAAFAKRTGQPIPEPTKPVEKKIKSSPCLSYGAFKGVPLEEVPIAYLNAVFFGNNVDSEFKKILGDVIFSLTGEPPKYKEPTQKKETGMEIKEMEGSHSLCPRYIIFDPASGFIDDANGFGYKTVEKAQKALWFKYETDKLKKKRIEKKRRRKLEKTKNFAIAKH